MVVRQGEGGWWSGGADRRREAPTTRSTLIPGGATRLSERTARTVDQHRRSITTTSCHAGNLHLQ